MRSATRLLRRDLRRVARRSRKIADQALNRAGKRADGFATRQIASQSGIQLSRVRWHHTNDGVRKGTRRIYLRRSRGDLTVLMWWTPRGRPPSITWSQLGARRAGGARNPRGVRAAGGRHDPHAFIAPAKGGRQVFKRQTSARYPLEVLRVDLESYADAAYPPEIIRARHWFRNEYRRMLGAFLDKPPPGRNRARAGKGRNRQ